ncbi:ankyrin repeat domain-containing protein [Spiroplasma endosymbiont of Danaus chrysippus]|uniref:ankyrin repeat domain-containing protein n=1 Tax=Spiroplasma endosymbiont of Danaus chrysippus TaxID=2691041 RepID=UPI00157A86CF|nr:ankyrin repeat domain-containing protein [Spiroplasma endosymbiont of Danaus chrysippus]
MKKILEELREKKSIHPLRTFNFGGLISKPFNEKKHYKSETVFDKLDELNKKIADWIKEKEKNQVSILILNLNNNQKQNVKLIINLENFYVQGFINNKNSYFYFDDELMEKVKQKNKEEIKKLESKIKKSTNKNELGKLNKKLKNLQGESLKKEEQLLKTLNNKIVKECNCQKYNLDYTGAYSESGLNVSKNENLDKKNFLGLSKGFLLSNNKNKEKNKFIKISKDTLEESIKNLANYSQNSKEDIKYDLTRLIFITSESIRFQCDEKSLKLFSKIKNKENLKKIINENKNILEDVQNVINQKNEINWNDYQKQIIGGWNEYSKEINNFRIEIWEQLINIKKIQNFVNKNKAKIDKIFNNEQKYEKKIEQFEDIILSESSEEDKELNEAILTHLKKELLIKDVLFYFQNKVYVKKINWNDFQEKYIFHIENKDNLLLNASIYQNNLDVIKLLINLNPESIVVNDEENCFFNPLFITINNQNIDIMQELLKHPKIEVNKLLPNLNISCLVYAVVKNNLEIVKELLKHPELNVNIKSICDVTALHIAVVKNNLEIVKELLKHPELNLNCVAKKDEGIEDFSLIITKLNEQLKKYHHSNNEADVQNIEFTPLFLAELFGRKTIIEELKNDVRTDTKKSLESFIEIELEKTLNSKEFEDELNQNLNIEIIKILKEKIKKSDQLLTIETLDLQQKEKIEKNKKEAIESLEEIFKKYPNIEKSNYKQKPKSKFEEEIEKIILQKINEYVNWKEYQKLLEDELVEAFKKEAKEKKNKQDESQSSTSGCKPYQENKKKKDDESDQDGASSFQESLINDYTQITTSTVSTSKSNKGGAKGSSGKYHPKKQSDKVVSEKDLLEQKYQETLKKLEELEIDKQNQWQKLQVIKSRSWIDVKKKVTEKEEKWNDDFLFSLPETPTHEPEKTASKQKYLIISKSK